MWQAPITAVYCTHYAYSLVMDIYIDLNFMNYKV
jgi:hypothetical protein